MTKAVWVNGEVDWRGRSAKEASPGHPPELTTERSQRGPWFCSWAAAAQLLGPLSWSLIHWQGDPARAPLVGVAFAAAGAAALVRAAMLHGSSAGDRRAKYNALLSGQAWLSWALLLAYYPSQPRAAIDVGVAATALLLLLPQAWSLHRLLRADLAPLDDAGSFRRALMVYRSTRWAGGSVGLRSAGAFLLSRLIDPTGYCFFLARYFAVEKLRRSKLLFLRAFNEPQSEALTTQVIAPLTERIPMEAWVRDRPAESGLQRVAPAGLTLRTIHVESAAWQLWLEQQLRDALAVVVDASREGANLSYEVKLALQLVPRERVVVLLPEGLREPRSGLGSITFDASAPSEARRPLERWLARVVAQARAVR